MGIGEYYATIYSINKRIINFMPDLIVKRTFIPVVVLLCIISAIARFVIDNSLPSLPAISSALNAQAGSVQLTLTLYIFGFGLSQLIYGPLSDRFGRKKLLVLGLIIFLIANSIGVFTHSLGVLLVARFLSGLGMGACGVLNRAITSDCYKGADFSKVWSYTTTTLVFVLIIAPIIGSCVQQIWGWRANLSISTILVGIALVLISWQLPETNHNKLTTITFQSVTGNYKKILMSRAFIIGTLCYTLAFSGLIAYFQISPFLLMDTLHLSPLFFGITSLVIASSYLVGGIIVRRLARLLGVRLLLIIGIFLLIASGLLMLSLCYEQQVSLFNVLMPTAIFVIGARIVIPNALAGAFIEFRHLGGSASGLMGGTQMLGTALISFIMTNFDHQSPLPLAFLFTSLGVISCMAFCYLYFYKNKYIYKHLIQILIGAIEFYRSQFLQILLHKCVLRQIYWLEKKYNRLFCVKKNSTTLLKAYQLCCQLFYKINKNKYINILLKNIDIFVNNKFGVSSKEGLIKLKNLAQSKYFLILMKLQSTYLYYYLYSAWYCASDICDRRRGL